MFLDLATLISFDIRQVIDPWSAVVHPASFVFPLPESDLFSVALNNSSLGAVIFRLCTACTGNFNDSLTILQLFFVIQPQEIKLVLLGNMLVAIVTNLIFLEIICSTVTNVMHVPSIVYFRCILVLKTSCRSCTNVLRCSLAFLKINNKPISQLLENEFTSHRSSSVILLAKFSFRCNVLSTDIQ